MTMKSSLYLDYLPPALWRDDPDPPGFSLGQLLMIFEKVLTGIDDEHTIGHKDHAHSSITAQIAAIDELLDPWKARPDFLPWLASWMALQYPALQGRVLWDEYQRRRATSQIARIYRERGLKSGLARYLELYAAGPTKLRIALDDGSRLLTTTPQPTQLAPVTALVTQGPVITETTVVSEGLARPWCAAMAPDGHIFVGDVGIPGGVSVAVKNRVWRFSPSGQYDLTGSPPRPQPIAADSLTLTSVIALSVRPAQSGAAETLYVLEQSGRLSAVPSPYLDQTATPVTTLAVGASTFSPVAMAVDTNGDLLILDRGDGAGTPNPPKIITVRPQPLSLTRTPLRQVIEPLSLLVRSGGELIIGDGRAQQPAPGEDFAANLIQVDRSTPDQWTETLVLPPHNPLVAPTGITEIDAAGLHVLDAGLKPFSPAMAGENPFVLPAAEPATVFLVDPAADPPAVSRVTEPGKMVYPTGMVADGRRLVICDPGLPRLPQQPTYLSRVRPFHLDVVVHFVDGQLPADPVRRAAVQRQVIGNIQAIVDQERPAHVEWNRITQGPDPE
jgi:phage tail-like protein